MPGNPYRIVMVFLTLLGAVVAILFTVFALTTSDPFRAISAWTIVYSAGGFATFWFAVWLIVSAVTWRPEAAPRGE